MNEKIVCEYESLAVKSFKSGIANKNIDDHLKSCADCQEALKVAGFFQANLAKEPPPLNLPAAGLIWWKARLREKHRAAARVGQPIFIVQIVSIGVFSGVFLWLFNTDVLQFSSLGEGFNRIAASMAQIVFPLIVAFIGFAVVSLAAVLFMRRVLPER